MIECILRGLFETIPDNDALSSTDPIFLLRPASLTSLQDFARWYISALSYFYHLPLKKASPILKSCVLKSRLRLHQKFYKEALRERGAL